MSPKTLSRRSPNVSLNGFYDSGSLKTHRPVDYRDRPLPILDFHISINLSSLQHHLSASVPTYLLMLYFADTLRKRDNTRTKWLSIYRLCELLVVPPGVYIPPSEALASVDVTGQHGFVLLEHDVMGDIDETLKMKFEILNTSMKYRGNAGTSRFRSLFQDLPTLFEGNRRHKHKGSKPPARKREELRQPNRNVRPIISRAILFPMNSLWNGRTKQISEAFGKP